MNQSVDLTIDSEDETEAIVIDSDYDSVSRKVENVKDEDKKSIYQQSEFPSASKSRKRKQEVRNGPIAHPFEVLDHWPEPDLRPGMTVEIKSKNSKDGDFVRIQDIIMNNTKDHDNILFRGQLLRRAKYVGAFTGTAGHGGGPIGGKMKRDLGELALVFEVDKDDPRPHEEQGMVTYSLSDILRIRNVVFTHEEFPRRSFRDTIALNCNDPAYELMRQSIKEEGVLVCRYAYTDYFEDARHRLAKDRRSREGCLRRIFMCDSEFRPAPEASPSTDSQPHHQAKSTRQSNGPVKKKKITYGSGCCGAGGDCEGARLGGATVKYGWDFDKSACASFELNHPNAKIHECAAEHFPPEGEDDSCDILHLSWPCDYFSPNHTREGKNDDANTGAILGTYEKLVSAKPRIHTQENTFGIDSHHPEYHAANIQQIVRAGYNVRWKVDQFADHGSPASRQRVVIIAAR